MVGALPSESRQVACFAVVVTTNVAAHTVRAEAGGTLGVSSAGLAIGLLGLADVALAPEPLAALRAVGACGATRVSATLERATRR